MWKSLNFYSYYQIFKDPIDPWICLSIYHICRGLKGQGWICSDSGLHSSLLHTIYHGWQQKGTSPNGCNPTPWEVCMDFLILTLLMFSSDFFLPSYFLTSHLSLDTAEIRQDVFPIVSKVLIYSITLFPLWAPQSYSATKVQLCFFSWEINKFMYHIVSY